MSFNDQYNKWKESTLKKSLEKFKERRERFETSAGIEIPCVALPAGGLDTSRDEHAGLLDQRKLLLLEYDIRGHADL
jgi:hypothetical protein